MKRPVGMALGKHKPKQDELFIPRAKVASGPGHPFYSKLNQVGCFLTPDDGFYKACGCSMFPGVSGPQLLASPWRTKAGQPLTVSQHSRVTNNGQAAATGNSGVR
jgi:hypothetical protein